MMLGACLRAVFFLLVLATSAVRAEPGAVARVALSVGEATRVDSGGRAEPLRLGAELSTGDRIITGKDAIAILVFADSGRVSLRADSELVIHRYRIDPSGGDTRLELELVRGAMRQISGDAARLQPERYRLNTPVAAIGVRGTDFLAKASPDSMETFVHEGMIVVLPKGNACALSAAAGSCVPIASLSASDAGHYLRVLSSGQVERRSLSGDEIERLFGIRLVSTAFAGPSVAGVSPGVVVVAGANADAIRTLNTRSGPQGAGTDPVELTGVATKTVSTAAEAPVDSGAAPAGLASVGAALAGGGGAGTVSKSDAVESIGSTGTAGAVAKFDVAGALGSTGTAASIVSGGAESPQLARLPTQLVWGRFRNAADLPMLLPVAYEQAREGRSVVVAELGQYALWRAGSPSPLDETLHGRAQFSLAAAEAVFAETSGVSPAEVRRASLAVDFDRSLFDASLTVAHQQTGPVSFSVNGQVAPGGAFWGGNAAQRVAGALSQDGKEAGFLFTKEHALGTFRGITLWNR